MKKLIAAAALAVTVLAGGASATFAASPATVVAAPSAALTRVNYLSFLNHYTSFLDTVGSDNDDWQFYSDWDDWDGMASVDLRTRNHNRTEYRWLNAHVPTQSCFRALWNSHKLEVHYSDLAYGYMYSFHHNGSLSAGKSGLYWLKKATTQINRSTAILKKTSC